MATITNTSAFASENFWTARQGAEILANATTYRFQNSAGLFVEVTGSGMTYAGGAPTGGTYVGIKVYASSSFTTQIAAYASATAIAFGTYFSSGAITALVGLDNLTGSTGNDILNGRSGADTISGGGGADQVFGDAGNDVFTFAVGENVAGEAVDGGADVDRIALSGAGLFDFSNDTLSGIEELSMHAGGKALFAISQGGPGSAIAVIGDTGANLLQFQGASGVTNLDLSNWTFANWGNPGDQIYIQASVVGAFNDVWLGSSQRDEMHGEFGNDSLVGGGGNDHLNGSAGADTLVGGVGDDEYVVDSQLDVVVEAAGEGHDVIFSPITYIMSHANVEELFLWTNNAIDGTGNIQANRITGNDAANNLSGAGGADTLVGGLGNDVLSGDAGDDQLIGGLGDDTYHVTDQGDITSEVSGQGIDTIFSTANYVMGNNIETMYLQEGTATDGITHSGGAGLVGNSNNNNLTGGVGSDVLLGQGGNDRIDGGIGADNMSGGVGDDTFYVDNIADLTSELAGQGNDIAFSSINFVLGANVETLYLVEGSSATDGITHAAGAGIVGNSNNNNLTGNSGNDVLLGQGGNDRIDGGIGADNMSGGTGDDTFYVDNIADLTSELAGEGNDTAFSSINFVLGANVETLYLVEGSAATDGLANEQGSGIIGNSNDNNLTGKGGVDVILGGAGGDRIEGGANNDNLNGQTGNDRLIGGIGNDNLTGETGNDFFIYTNINEGGGAGDTITDFTIAGGADQDALDLRLMWGTFTGTAGITTAAQAVASGHLTFSQSGSSTQVSADANGGAHNPGEQILLATVFNTTAAGVQGLTLIV